MFDCRFDDSLPRLLKVLSDKLGKAQIEAGVVLRDATGRLGFFVDADIDPDAVREIDEIARVRWAPIFRLEAGIKRRGGVLAPRHAQRE